MNKKINFTLKDHFAEGLSRLGKKKLPSLKARIEITPRGIGIGFEGYGDKGSAPGMGQPVFIEFYNGKVKVHVWADINQEDVTHSIDLSGAQETALKMRVVGSSPLDEKLLGKKVAKRAADIAPSANVKSDCRKCGSTLKKNGRCPDVTCPYSDHPQTWDYDKEAQ